MGQPPYMKNLIVSLVLLAGAVIVRVLRPFSSDLAWRADKYTHRGISINVLVFWTIVAISAVLLILEAVQLLRRVAR